MRSRCPFVLIIAALAAGSLAGMAQEKVTYQDHILPIVEANCAKCHNSDKKKGDLDLTSYSAAVAGGASGKVLASGDPAREISQAAEREGCDLIAMATHGHKFIGDMIHGSVSHTVRHASTTPVLLVRGNARGRSGVAKVK